MEVSHYPICLLEPRHPPCENASTNPTFAVYMCEDIEGGYSVTASQLTTWNTWLASDCDRNLYANLLSNETRPVCVGVNASEPIGSLTSGPTEPSQTAFTGTNIASMGPTASGEVAGCKQYYTVQSGDSCTNIETIYGISFAQFYAWNPSSMFISTTVPAIDFLKSKLIISQSGVNVTIFGSIMPIASRVRRARAPRPQRQPPLCLPSQASHRTVTNITPLRAATRVRRLNHSTTTRLRSCIRGTLRSVQIARICGWAMRFVWEFREWSKSGERLLEVL